jgi:hypothetical protein
MICTHDSSNENEVQKIAFLGSRFAMLRFGVQNSQVTSMFYPYNLSTVRDRRNIPTADRRNRSQEIDLLGHFGSIASSNGLNRRIAISEDGKTAYIVEVVADD